MSAFIPIPVGDRPLASSEVQAALSALFDPAVEEKAKAVFLTDWARRGETAEELAACADALLPRAVDPGLRGSHDGQPLLDCCGTGGGGLPLFNVSTGLMFILSALGIPVVKHGNRGQTKPSGSADVLEALGLRIDLPPALAVHCLEETGCAFLFAPAYQPGFAAIASVRKKLASGGQRTVFNLLGPLLNPARPAARLVGVFSREHVELYARALTAMNCPRFTVACGFDATSGRPLGEVSASGPTLLATRGLAATELPALSQATPAPLEALFVRDAAESATRLRALLAGDDRGPGRDLLVLNAAVAALTQGRATTLEEGRALAEEVLDSGQAMERLRRWQAFSAHAT